MRAASSSSEGIAPCAYCRSRKIPNALTAPGTISAWNVPTQPRFDMMTNEGTVDSCDGIMNVASRMTNRTFLPGNSNFANANAAIESKNSTSTVVAIATINVLSVEPAMSMLSKTLRNVLQQVRAGREGRREPEDVVRRPARHHEHPVEREDRDRDTGEQEKMRDDRLDALSDDGVHARAPLREPRLPAPWTSLQLMSEKTIMMTNSPHPMAAP